MAFRVLADHARTLAVCLNDKVGFSNEGVGYVARRILRRAIRYSNDILKLDKGLLSQMVKIAGDFMGFNLMVSVVDDEENLFFKTLIKGKMQYDKIKNEKNKLTGSDVFLLYDTYGFPKDLTELMAKEDGIEIDMTGFEDAKNAARELSKSLKNVITINFVFPETDDSLKYKKINDVEANLMAAVYKNEIVNELPLNEQACVVFDKTCFYGECGGQVGDTGFIKFYNAEEQVGLFEVEDTQIQRGYVLHLGKLISGRLTSNAKLLFDEERRNLISCNHSTTHILNYFLRKITETEQEGSLVDSKKCRFDFESKKLSDNDLIDLENNINDFVHSNATVSYDVYDRERVLADSSIIKMTNENYPDMVRVITMKNDKYLIKEVCGGTHVSNTSEIKLVKIISETGVKANTRRIIAVSNECALQVSEEGNNLLEQARLGKIVRLNSQLSLKDKKELEFLNNANLKKNSLELKSLIKSVEAKIDDSIKNHGLYVQELTEFSDYSPKEKKKLFSDISKKASLENEFFLFILVQDAYDISIFSKNGDKVLENLKKIFSDSIFRFSGQFIQGSIHKDIFDINAVLNLLK